MSVKIAFIFAFAILEVLVSVANALTFTSGSAMGYFMALAVPIDLDDQNVYMSFNFEANYGLPLNDSIFENGLFQKWGFDKRSTNDQQNDLSFRAAFTRTNFYASFEKYLFYAGKNGTACLLRTICEAATEPIGEINGMVGDVFHILFTPSSSMDEQLPKIVYEAEVLGQVSDCRFFNEDCPNGVLDIISRWITI